ncbi:MAG: 50S ribosomal protein L15 [Cellulomonas sp.]|nr:50S ribosomal protein L15 [Cellulomonas sp.]
MADDKTQDDVATATAPVKKAPATKVVEPDLGAGGTLKVHHLRPAPGAKTAKTRVGRGEASKGKTAGRGTKGQKAKRTIPERFEGGQMPLHMRLPKLRGFKNPFRTEYQVVNLDKLSELYPSGGSVTVDDLVAKGAVRKGQLVKVLGTGELTVKVSIAVDAYSASAKEKIAAAGGTVEQD